MKKNLPIGIFHGKIMCVNIFINILEAYYVIR